MKVTAGVDGKIEVQMTDGSYSYIITIAQCRDLIHMLNIGVNKAEAYMESDCNCRHMPGRRATGVQPCNHPEATAKECALTTEGAKRFCPLYDR
jgi:hypothetical protein